MAPSPPPRGAGDLPLVCRCEEEPCVCPGGRQPPPAALALSNKRKADEAAPPELDMPPGEEDEDEDLWVELANYISELTR